MCRSQLQIGSWSADWTCRFTCSRAVVCDVQAFSEHHVAGNSSHCGDERACYWWRPRPGYRVRHPSLSRELKIWRKFYSARTPPGNGDDLHPPKTCWASQSLRTSVDWFVEAWGKEVEDGSVLVCLSGSMTNCCVCRVCACRCFEQVVLFLGMRLRQQAW